MSEKPLRILALDGGGVRGISTLYILKEIMRQVARNHCTENPQGPKISPLPCDYFDLICGTSTGGPIALMIGRLKMVMLNFSILTGILVNSKYEDGIVKEI